MKREKGQHRETVEKKKKGETPRVFLKRAPDGSWRRQWVGRWSRDGKKHDATLCRWEGTPPGPDATEEGLALFERSREKAIALLKEAMRKDVDAREEAVIVQRVHSIRYGRKVGRVKLAELAERWDALPHKADLTEARRERVHSVLWRFVGFMGQHFPNVTEAGALTPEHFKAFFAEVEKWGVADPPKNDKGAEPKEEPIGVTARTWNDVLDILRGTLRKVDGQSVGFREYLANLPKRTPNTIHRRPFTGGELDSIFAAAAAVDPELHPVLVAAACTALRRGDVCGLRWDDIDLAEGFVTVKTSKTGETVEIPIFPPFRAVLEEAERMRRNGVPYVFPAIAAAYQRNADGLNVRLRRVLEAAGFVIPEKVSGGQFPAPSSPADAVAKVDAGTRAAGWTEARRQKGLAILQRHLNGETGKDIAAAMGIARGAVSTYLHEMEAAGAVALITPPKAEETRKTTLAEVKDGEQRKHRGSLCGWHSFRTTFCTLALANGVPMDILRKITGHRTAEIVLKHYDRRGREAMKRAIGAAMPKAIAGAVERSAAVRSGGGEELVAVPVEVAKVAEMLAGADAATLAKVAEMLKGGDK